MSAPAHDRYQSFDHSQIIDQFEGGLNDTYVVEVELNHKDSRKLAIRIPKSDADREKTHELITAEYRKIGVNAVGIDFRLRNMEEQQQLMSMAAGFGLHTLECDVLLGNEMATEFMDGVPLSEYVAQETASIDPTIIRNVLTHLTQAHSVGIVFGDRWAKNTMILQSGEHKEFDFDIELQGDTEATSSFELAQTLYHLIHFADNNRNFILELICDLYDSNPSLLAAYNKTTLLQLLDGQRIHFVAEYLEQGSLYEGIAPSNSEIARLIEKLDTIWQKVPMGTVTNQLPVIQLSEGIHV